MKNILDAPFMEEMKKTTANMYRLGWDERNGGNISYLLDTDETSTEFAVRITNIPAEHNATMIYARAYYVFEYEGREVVMYDDIQAANYINKYESNDGVLEW